MATRPGVSRYGHHQAYRYTTSFWSEPLFKRLQNFHEILGRFYVDLIFISSRIRGPDVWLASMVRTRASLSATPGR